MKKIYLVISVVMMFSLTSLAQICNPPCTPDVSCIEVENPGQICPEVLPPATVNVYYDEASGKGSSFDFIILIPERFF